MQRTKTSLVLQQLFLLICSVILLGSCGGRENIEDGFSPPDSIQRKVPVIINQIPHDNQAYTQGLLYYNGFLYESTGLNCCSSIRKLDASSGMLVNRVDFSNKFQTTQYFGEGLARKDNELVQLTWLSRIAFIWQFPGPYSNFDTTGVYEYSGQGWGLTADDTLFIMSNGSDTLYYRDNSFDITSKLPVKLRGVPLDSLNELELVDGTVYANVLESSYIYGINAQTGAVDEIIDCTSLIQIAQPTHPDDVLNGIAHDSSSGHFYLTGKRWRFIFEVDLADTSGG